MLETHDKFRDLMGRVQEGSEDAAWELVHRYGDAIRRAVRRTLSPRMRSKFDSLDFVQLVWCSFFRARDQAIRFSRPEELVSFLVTMARNKVGLEVRRRLLTDKFSVDREQSLVALPAKAEESTDGDLDPIKVAIAREQWDRLIAEQPDQYRQILSLRLQGLTCRDIAESLNIAACTVRRFLNKLLDDRVR